MATEITIKQIQDLLLDGMTYQKIADKFGVTKNTVIGRMSRFRRASGSDFAKSKKTKNIKHQVEHPKNIIGGIDILELKNDSCRFMIGEHRYCGQGIARKAYCLEHANRCYEGKRK